PREAGTRTEVNDLHGRGTQERQGAQRVDDVTLVEVLSIRASNHPEGKRLLEEKPLVGVQSLGGCGVDLQAEQVAPPTPSLMFHVKHPPRTEVAEAGSSIEWADHHEPIRILTTGSALNAFDAR